MLEEMKKMDLNEMRATVAKDNDDPACRWLSTILRGVQDDAAGHWRWCRSSLTIPVPRAFRKLFGNRTTQPRRAIFGAIHGEIGSQVAPMCGQKDCLRVSHVAVTPRAIQSRDVDRNGDTGAIRVSVSPARVAQLTAALFHTVNELTNAGINPTALLQQQDQESENFRRTF